MYLVVAVWTVAVPGDAVQRREVPGGAVWQQGGGVRVRGQCRSAAAGKMAN